MSDGPNLIKDYRNLPMGRLPKAPTALSPFELARDILAGDPFQVLDEYALGIEETLTLLAETIRSAEIALNTPMARGVAAAATNLLIERDALLDLICDELSQQDDFCSSGDVLRRIKALKTACYENNRLVDRLATKTSELDEARELLEGTLNIIPLSYENMRKLIDDHLLTARPKRAEGEEKS